MNRIGFQPCGAILAICPFVHLWHLIASTTTAAEYDEFSRLKPAGQFENSARF